MASGVEMIAEERRRQEQQKGYTKWHDLNRNSNEQLARAASVYAMPLRFRASLVGRLWPWWKRYYKPGDRVRELAKAGALIAAEIDRLNANQS